MRNRYLRSHINCEQNSEKERKQEDGRRFMLDLICELSEKQLLFIYFSSFHTTKIRKRTKNKNKLELGCHLEITKY